MGIWNTAVEKCSVSPYSRKPPVMRSGGYNSKL